MRTGDTKQKLLQVALDLIWESSYGSVGVDDICAQAKVTKGSFYHAFKSKSDLAVAAFEYYYEQRRPALDRIFSPQSPPAERLRQYCRMQVADQRDKYQALGKIIGCPFSSVGCELSTQDENIRQKARELSARTTRYIESAVRDLVAEGVIEDTDAGELAKEAYAYVTGVLTQSKIDNDLRSVERIEPGMFRLLGVKSLAAA